MKKCIIYNVIIYMFITMIIILQKPDILTDVNGNFKSWNYLKFNLSNGISDYNDLICLPTVVIVISIISFVMSKQLTITESI